MKMIATLYNRLYSQEINRHTCFDIRYSKYYTLTWPVYILFSHMFGQLLSKNNKYKDHTKVRYGHQHTKSLIIVHVLFKMLKKFLIVQICFSCKLCYPSIIPSLETKYNFLMQFELFLSDIVNSKLQHI